MASVNYFESAQIGLGATTPAAPRVAAFNPGPLPERRYFAEGIEAGVEGLKSAGYGAVALGARALGAEGVEAAALKRSREAGETAGALTPRVQDVNSVGAAWNFAKFGLGSALPSMATTVLGAIGGGGAARLLTRNAMRESTKQFAQTVGAGAGGMGASSVLEAGSIYPEALETGVEDPGLRAALGGVAAGSLDALGPLLLARRFGAFGRQAADAGVVGQGGVRGAAQTAGLDMLKMGATEVPTEVAQEVIGRGAAGKPIGDDEALSDYANVAALTLPTAILGGPGGAYRGFRGPQGEVVPAQEQPAAPAAPAAPEPAQAAPVAAPVVEGAPVVAPAAAAPAAPPVVPIREPGTAFATRDEAVAERDAIGSNIAALQDKAAWEARKKDLSDRLQALMAEQKAPKEERRSIQDIRADIKQVKERGKALAADIKAAPEMIKALQARQADAESALALIGDGSFESQAPLQNALAERETLTGRISEIQSTLDAVRGVGGAPGIKPEFAGTSEAELKKLAAEQKSAKKRLEEVNSKLALVPEIAPADVAIDMNAAPQPFIGDAKLRPLPDYQTRVKHSRDIVKRGGRPSAAVEVVRKMSADEQAKRDAETVGLENQSIEAAKELEAFRAQKRAEIDAAYQQLDAKQEKQKAREVLGLIDAARMDRAAAEIARAEAEAVAAEAPEQVSTGPMQQALLDAGKARVDPMLNDAMAYIRKAGRADAGQMAKALNITRPRADAMVAKLADWQYVGDADKDGVRPITKAPEPKKAEVPKDVASRSEEYEVWRKLKAGEQLDTITDEDLNRAAERGSASVRRAALKELLLRLETETAGMGRDGDVRPSAQAAAAEAAPAAEVDVAQERQEKLRRQIQKMTPRNDPLIKWIVSRGGIDRKYAEDITGEKAFNANKYVPGLFKAPKFSQNGQQMDGWGLDEIASQAGADGEGFITWDENTDTGGVKALTLAIQRAINKDSRNVRFGDEEAEFKALQANSEWNAAREEASKLGVDLTEAKTLEEAWDMIDRAAQIKAMAEGPLSAQFAEDEDFVARAAAIDEDAVERAAVMFEDDSDAFMAEIRRIVNEADAEAAAQSGQAAQQAQAASPGSPSQGSGGAQEQAAGEPGQVESLADLFAETKARREAVETALSEKYAADEIVIGLDAKRPGWKYVLTTDTENANKVRVTSFKGDEPWGHRVYNNPAEAATEFLGLDIQDGPLGVAEGVEQRYRGQPDLFTAPDIQPVGQQTDLFNTLAPQTPRQVIERMTAPAPQIAPPQVKLATIVEPVTTSQMKIGIETVNGPGDAAHVLASLRKSAEERFVILALDAEKRPIAVFRLTHGGVAAVNVYPDVVAGAVYQTPGVASIWYSHNHPSGTAEASAADRNLTSSLTRLFGPDTGITVDGHVIIAGDQWRALDASGNTWGQAEKIPAFARKFSVPVRERMFKRSGTMDSTEVTSVAAAIALAKKHLDGKSGVLMFDTRNRLVGVLEMDSAQMAKLRNGPNGNAATLFGGLGRANAQRAIIVTASDGPADVAAAHNVGRALKTADIVQLDVIQNGASWASSGMKAGAGGGAFHSMSAMDRADAVLATRAEIGKEITSVIDRMIGGQSDLEVRMFTQRDPEGFVGRYRATPYKDVIEIAVNAEAPMSAAAHEGFHYVESRLLTKQEREVLNRGLRRGSALYKRVKEVANEYDASRGTDISSSIDSHPMEAHAYAYQFWMEGKLSPTTAMERAFQKLRQVFEKLRNWIDGYGFQSTEELFDAVNRGVYAKQGRAFMVDANELYDSLDKDLLSRASTVQTPEFRKWFEGSKVVDADGNPLVVYHTTPNDFDSFVPGGDDATKSGRAIWFGVNPMQPAAAHNVYVRGGVGAFREGSRTIPVYLSMKRPMILDDATTIAWARSVWGDNFPQLMGATILNDIKKDYDGVIYKPVDRPNDAEYVVFSGEQVKSAIGNRGTFDASSPSILYSDAAVARGSIADMLRAAQNGEGGYSQLMSAVEKQLVDAPEPTVREILGESARQRVNSLKRFYLDNFSSGHNISKYSSGFKNVFDVLTRYTQRKNRLISDNLEVGLSSWLPWARTEKGVKVTSEDVAAASQKLMQRTVKAMRKDSAEYQQLVGSMTGAQRELFDQAGAMIEKMLWAEFEAEKPGFAAAFRENPAEYAQWESNRKKQVAKLIEEGYIPERRYGDHAAHVYTTMTDAKGQTKKVTLYYSLNEDEADARLEVKALTKELQDVTDIKVEYGFRYKPEFDASLSYKQFIEMAEASGIKLEQAERERIAKSLIAADSTRRLRIFRRKNIPGYSEDGTRVLAEFVVNVSNKVAGAEFGDAVKEALRGRPVAVSVQNGEPQIAIDQQAQSVWDKDGELAGYFNGLAQRTVDFAMGPGENAPASRIMRAAAGFNFLGGSAATALVQLSSLPMNVVPNLMQHTNSADAVSTMWGAAQKAFRHQKVLRDLNALRSNVELPGIDSDLRTALTRAGEDGTTLDTELYQLMGLTRGALAAKSRLKQKAVDVWMFPFRWSEQVNRISTFIAGWETGKKKGLAGEDLYGFAQKLVYDTQFRYDEANRPAITRSPMWAVLFTFKSYPIYMMEMVTALAKEKPQAAVALLAGVAVAAGINGLPFAEDIMDVIDTIAQRLFNQPFNSKRAIRNWLKNASEAIAGADYSGVMMNGIINEMTSLNFASRVGLGNLIPGTRLLAKDTDSADQLQELTGPVGSMVSGWVKGAGELLSGDLYGAAREALPAGGKNLLKAGEQFKHGYAMDAKGQRIVDVGGWEAFAQGLGFSSRSLGLAYDLDRMDKQGAAFYKQMRQEMVGQIVSAIRSGDKEAIDNAVGVIGAWNSAHPEMMIAPDVSSLRRAIIQAQLPLNQRTLQLLPRHMRSQSISAEGIDE